VIAAQMAMIVVVSWSFLGTRVLLHPHESKQPFTQSLAGVAIPETARRVVARARDKVHGSSGREITVAVPAGVRKNRRNLLLYTDPPPRENSRCGLWFSAALDKICACRIAALAFRCPPGLEPRTRP